MTDQDIITLIRTNAYHPAMKSLYAYFPVVKKFVLKNQGTRQEAEDIFQEGLVIFCRKLEKPEFVLSCSLNTYVYSICKLLWLDELKKKSRRMQKDTLPFTDELLTDSIQEDVEQDKPIKQAQEAVMKLGQKCKDLLALFYFKKLSLKDIAAQLNFSSEKVAKNQKYRCIEKAKEHFKNASL